jgi:hypothetical protein
MDFARTVNQPSAFLPPAMSVVALAMVAGRVLLPGAGRNAE